MLNYKYIGVYVCLFGFDLNANLGDWHNNYDPTAVWFPAVRTHFVLTILHLSHFCETWVKNVDVDESSGFHIQVIV